MTQQEQHWVQRRNVWLRQYDNVETMNDAREELAEALEECSVEVRRLVTPIMHHKITEAALFSLHKEAKDNHVSLVELLENRDQLELLRTLRARIDDGGL